MDPSDFRWSEGRQNNQPSLRITHAPTGSYFEFAHAPHSDGFWLSWSPMFTDGRRYAGAGDWFEAAGIVAQWCGQTKEDHDAPDLWGELSKQAAIPKVAGQGADSQPFTPDELRLLEAGLDDIEHFITSSQPLPPDAVATVHGRFQYLREAAKRGVRKVDWLNIFVGQMISLVAERILVSSFYQPLMAHAATALKTVFDFGLKLIGP
jgi:hypothetical protein